MKIPKLCKFFVASLLILFAALHGSFASPDVTIGLNPILENYVSMGEVDGVRLNVVDYGALRKSPDFKAALKLLKEYDPSDLRGADRLAFYINAYNLLAMKTVADAWPVDSIQDAGKDVWDRNAGKIGGQDYSLNYIEEEILGLQFQDLRVHFALACASVSCPDLRTKAYEGTTLNDVLDEQTRSFLRNPGKGLRIDRENKVVWLSPVFKWYEDDFNRKSGPIKFIMNYVPDDEKRFLESWDYDVKYMDYNWKLNAPAK
ncbi:MAG: DUF547 domain-containing protein [Chloroflexi bacterium]|nr:DUF547 domain-containing protein [Chloroflexota bacterium]